MTTLKEAVLKSLEELESLVNHRDVYNHITKNKYYDFGSVKTPLDSVSSNLGDFIRNGDSRVKRIKREGGTYSYYLAKNEENIQLSEVNLQKQAQSIPTKENTYDERDLHILLSSYLNSEGIFSKTIYHEKSLNSKDSNQKWLHPDLVAISLSNLKTTAAKALMRSINQLESIRIYSYELKKEISNDFELKQSFFQTVSNSSWANYGYLVALEINDNLMDELERLCESFGIGFILLSSYPYESRILFQSKFKPLDFKSIDKLCHVNNDFKKFIELTDNILSSEEKFRMATEKEYFEFCDKCFTNDEEVREYLEKKNIPNYEGFNEFASQL